MGSIMEDLMAMQVQTGLTRIPDVQRSMPTKY